MHLLIRVLRIPIAGICTETSLLAGINSESTAMSHFQIILLSRQNTFFYISRSLAVVAGGVRTGRSLGSPPALWGGGGHIGTALWLLALSMFSAVSCPFWASDTGESSPSSSLQPSATSTHCWSLHQQVTASALKVYLCLCLGTGQETPLSWAGQLCPDPDDCSTRGANGQCRLHKDSADSPAATRLNLSAALPVICSLLPAMAHLPLAAMQAQDCSQLPTRATYLPRLTCPCSFQARRRSWLRDLPASRRVWDSLLPVGYSLYYPPPCEMGCS